MRLKAHLLLSPLRHGPVALQQIAAARDAVATVDQRIYHRVADGQDEEHILQVLVHAHEGCGVDEVPAVDMTRRAFSWLQKLYRHGIIQYVSR